MKVANPVRSPMSWFALAACVVAGTPDAQPQVTERVSVDNAGNEGAGWAPEAALSRDGRYAVFTSSSDLGPGDDSLEDIYLRDRRNQTTIQVSLTESGQQPNGTCGHPSISADGDRVAFASRADNLVPGDQNGAFDVFVKMLSTGKVVRASVSSAGVEGNETSWFPKISGDGRYVVFQSFADNLVPGDSNGLKDVFVHDLELSKTQRVSVDSAGNEANGESARFNGAAISGNGRFVAFESEATNLVPGDGNGLGDVFLHDRSTGQTTRISVGAGGAESDGTSIGVSLSWEGDCVAFASYGTNLVPGDTNYSSDVFVADLAGGSMERVSVSSEGREGDFHSLEPVLSADGTVVAFSSDATNLVPLDDNFMTDVFVHRRTDRHLAQTVRVSVSSDGGQANQVCWNPGVSHDGRFVSFVTHADNLVPGDGNGLTDAFVHGPELTLETSATELKAGDSLDLATWAGAPGGLGWLVVTEVDSVPFWWVLNRGRFDAQGEIVRNYVVPPGLTGLDVTLSSLGVARRGQVEFSNELHFEVR